MDTNKEAVFSLIRLLVRKAGSDLDKNTAEEELEKTKENLKRLYLEKETSGSNKNLDKMIENVKVRQAFWENNAEIIGKSLLKSFEEGKSYNNVKLRIDHLVNLATKGTKDLEVSYIYSRNIELEEEYNSLIEKINTSDYINNEEKEMDSKYKTYLENKIESINKELEEVIKELDNLREVETKDVVIVNKIKVYNESLERNFKKLEQARSETINTDITFDVWEKLETARNDIETKLEKSKEALEKTENMLSDVRNNRSNLSNRKASLESEFARCSSKLETVTAKLMEDNYLNEAERMMDLSKSEMLKQEAESLKNKKDYIYVDTTKVKEELEKEWDLAVKAYKERLKKEKKKKIEETTIEKSNDVVEDKKENDSLEIKTNNNDSENVEVKDESLEKTTDVNESVMNTLKEIEETSKIVEGLIEDVNEENVNSNEEETIKEPIEETLEEENYNEIENELTEEIQEESKEENLSEVKEEKKNKYELEW